jgi:Spy/CpxP family protein refolding chaperone
MSKLKQFLSGVAVGGLAVGGAVFGLKQRKPAPRGYLDLIDLTTDQRCKVEAIREGFLPRVAGIRAALKERRMELADLLFARELDRDKVHAMVEEIAAHQRQLEEAVIEHIIEENALLTPEQQRQFHRVIVGQFRGGGLGIHDIRGK